MDDAPKQVEVRYDALCRSQTDAMDDAPKQVEVCYDALCRSQTDAILHALLGLLD